MARNSQQRRARQKRLQEQAERRQERSRGETSSPPPVPDLERLVRITAQTAQASSGKDAFNFGIARLVAMEASGQTQPSPRTMAATLLARDVSALFENGWQPADVAHIIKREWSARAHRLVVALIAAHARQVDAVMRAPQPWLAQLEDLGVYESADAKIVGGQGDYVRAWANSERLHADDVLSVELQILSTLQMAPKLSFLIEPPTRWSASNRGAFPKPRSTPAGDVDAKALKLIRALLAKAEATNFDAEAEAFTAKAQEMMTRHSIDAAVIASANKGSGNDLGIESRRVHIDNPYADEKATFLSIIADVNGVRSIWSPHTGLVTVMGYPVDLHLTDLLFTSLLVQATKASAEATSTDRRSRTPSYRRAFLLSYAYRIGERLRAAKQHTSAEAQHDYGESLLPILADRQAAVDQAYDEAFPDAKPMRGRSLDSAGYHAGRAAADRAHIGAGEAIARAGSR
jgi:Protein of unknown function (DUF2786)